MILIVTRPNKIVQNAFFNQTDLAFNLFINTVHKWIRFDSYASEYGHKISEHSVTWYYFNEEKPNPDTVQLIAESNDDQGILSRIKFEQHNKDQMWLMMPKECVYTELHTQKDNDD